MGRENHTFLILSSENVKEKFRSKRFQKIFFPYGLEGFSKIRNIGLLLAQALSMDVVIFIDNDEVLEAPDYLRVACEFLNQRWNGRVVAGKGGFYVNPDGTILLPPRRLWWIFSGIRRNG